MISYTHLTVFEAIMRTKRVSLAAENLDMPQPTLSRHLKQLRDHFDNQLFVRTSTGLEPTTLAVSISPAIAQTLEIFRTRLSKTAEFDAASADREFHITASDVGHLLVFPSLIEWTKTAAPGVRYRAMPLGRDKLLSRLESGEVDVAIGSFPALHAGVLEQALFAEEYVCVVPRNILPEGPLTLALFKAASHVLVDGRQLGHFHEDVERLLVKTVGAEKIAVTAESFLLSAHIAEQSELILTSPSRLAAAVDRSRVRLLPPPLQIPGFTVKQYWHERFHDDPGNRWLRRTISRLRGRSAPLAGDELFRES